MKLKKIYPLICIGILALMVLGGCLPKRINKTEQIDKRELLHQRVDDYFSAKNAGDVENEYHFLAPSSKASTSLSQFIKMRGSSSSQSVVESIDYVPGSDNALVYFKSTIFYGAYKLNKIRSKQDWIFLHGKWYFNTKKRSVESLFEFGSGNK